MQLQTWEALTVIGFGITIAACFIWSCCTAEELRRELQTWKDCYSEMSTRHRKLLDKHTKMLAHFDEYCNKMAEGEL